MIDFKTIKWTFEGRQDWAWTISANGVRAAEITAILYDGSGRPEYKATNGVIRDRQTSEDLARYIFRAVEMHEKLEDAHDDIVQALGADLETGSHHFNNTAHARFAKEYPRLVEAINKMGKLLSEQKS